MGRPMTEAEWLACEEPDRMLASLRGRVSGRKARLCVCGCCRAARAEPGGAATDRAVAVGERWADGRPPDPAEADAAWDELGAASDAADAAIPPGVADAAPYEAVLRLLHAHACLADDPLSPFAYRPPLRERLREALALLAAGALWRRYRPPHVALWMPVVRCVFGNPFRPAAFSPELRTDTAVALARQMYEARDFSAMPILADALQDVGYDNDSVLNHCRESGPHVRGCWVVDLVLSKE